MEKLIIAILAASCSANLAFAQANPHINCVEHPMACRMIEERQAAQHVQQPASHQQQQQSPSHGQQQPAAHQQDTANGQRCANLIDMLEDCKSDYNTEWCRALSQRIVDVCH